MHRAYSHEIRLRPETFHKMNSSSMDRSHAGSLRFDRTSSLSTYRSSPTNAVGWNWRAWHVNC